MIFWNKILFQEPSFLLHPLKSVEIDYIMAEKPSDNSITFSFSLGTPYPCINIRKSDPLSDTPMLPCIIPEAWEQWWCASAVAASGISSASETQDLGKRNKEDEKFGKHSF